MQLEKNMYVRFVTGFDIKMDKPIIRIGKIEGINDYCITINVFSRQIIVSLKEFEKLKIKEPSFNIIDLIEVGDYVNGSKVLWFMFDEEKSIKQGIDEKIGVEVEGKFNPIEYLNKDIKSIVTKEQFESMAYKVGD